MKNVDIQVETNRIRPFTYSHFDTVANYTHYNMPLAHPLGANLQEYIAIIRAQPTPRLYLQWKAITWTQGLDRGGINYGSNPLRDYDDRTMDIGYFIGTGDRTRGFNSTIHASYELKENLFLDFTGQIRRLRLESGGRENTSLLSAGIRWNMARRVFDF